MKLSRDRFGELIDVLDGIRADNREGKYDDEIKLRPIEHDLLLYIERKGYCKYEINNLRFIRVLTEKGLDVLASQNYGKYKKRKRWERTKSNIPLITSLIALMFTGLSFWHNTKSRPSETQKRIDRLETIQDSMHIQMIKVLNKSLLNKSECFSIDSTTQ